MKKRFLIPLPIIAIVIAAGALFLTRGSGSSGGSAEASGQVATAFANVQELKSFTMRQSMVMKADGKAITVDQEMTIEVPDRIYTKTSGSGQTVEMVLLGERVYIRENGPGWRILTLRDLGIDPSALYETNEQQFLPPELKILGTVKEDGVELIHYRGKLDGQELLDMMSEAFLEDSPMRRAFGQIEVKKLEVDYYIGKADQLPYRGTMHMVMEAKGDKFETISSFEYSGFNEPLVLPAGLPVTP